MLVNKKKKKTIRLQIFFSTFDPKVAHVTLTIEGRRFPPDVKYKMVGDER